jgi:hypothetical protein
VGHIIEADRRGFGGRIQRILAENGVAETGWDNVGIAAARRDWERPVSAVLEEFTTSRDAGLAVVDGLAEEDLDRYAMHAVVGRVTVRNLLHEWVFHDRNHIRQLLANSGGRAGDGQHAASAT